MTSSRFGFGLCNMRYQCELDAFHCEERAFRGNFESPMHSNWRIIDAGCHPPDGGRRKGPVRRFLFLTFGDWSFLRTTLKCAHLLRPLEPTHGGQRIAAVGDAGDVLERLGTDRRALGVSENARGVWSICAECTTRRWCAMVSESEKLAFIYTCVDEHTARIRSVSGCRKLTATSKGVHNLKWLTSVPKAIDIHFF